MAAVAIASTAWGLWQKWKLMRRKFGDRGPVPWAARLKEIRVTELKTLAPLHDRVAVRPDPAEGKIGSIVLPDSSQHPPRKGTVVAVGPGRYASETGILIPPTVKVGDRVMWSNWGDVPEAKVAGEEWFVLREGDLYGVIGE